MRNTDAAPDGFEVCAAIAFAAVAVLGTLVVVLTASLYLSGGDGSVVPLP